MLLHSGRGQWRIVELIGLGVGRGLWRRARMPYNQFLGAPGQRNESYGARFAQQGQPAAGGYGYAGGPSIPEFDIAPPSNTSFGGPETSGLDDIPF